MATYWDVKHSSVRTSLNCWGLAWMIGVWMACLTGAAMAQAVVDSWGDNRYGQQVNYSGITNAVSVGGGSNLCAILDANGTLNVWREGNKVVMGTAFADLTQMSVGMDTIAAIDRSGKVAVWYSVTQGSSSFAVSPQVAQISAGAGYCLWLKADGVIEGTGDNTFLQINAPTNSAYIGLAAGFRHSLAIKSNGTVVAFGQNLYGEGTPPASLSNVVAVSAGESFSMALKKDGTVVVFGRTDSGQTNYPPGLTNIVAISAGFSHCLALRRDGVVLAWGGEGTNDYGQTTVPGGLTNCVAIGAGSWHSMAVAAPSSIYIQKQPVDYTNYYPYSAVFSISAISPYPASYQWYGNGNRLSGATQANLTITNPAVTLAAPYYVVVSNVLGTVTSITAYLTIDNPPNIGEALNSPGQSWSTEGDATWVSQCNVTGDGQYAIAVSGFNGSAPGKHADLILDITNTCRITFWWWLSSSSSQNKIQCWLDGQLVASISRLYSWEQGEVIVPEGIHRIKWVASQNVFTYDAPVAAMDMVVISTNGLVPEIVSPLQDYRLPASTNLTLAPLVIGYSRQACQWKLNGTDILNATNLQYTIRNLQTWHEGDYSLVVSNFFGMTTGKVAVVSVLPAAPVFSEGQAIARMTPGLDAALTAIARGSEPMSYQWFRDGEKMADATNVNLVLRQAQPSQLGYYTVVVSNAGGVAEKCFQLTTAGQSRYIVHISCDGMGSLYLTNEILRKPYLYPNLFTMIHEGASTLNARCDYNISYTVPNHVCMLTGRPVYRPPGIYSSVEHGYTDDRTKAGVTLHSYKSIYKSSVFDVVHDNGMSTAFIVGKTSLQVCEMSYNSTNGASDATPPDNGRAKVDYASYVGRASDVVNTFLGEYGNNKRWNYAFLHFSDLDLFGHYYGWGSESWYSALESMDVQLGRLMTAIKNSTNEGDMETTIILTADHGGVGGGHNNNLDLYNCSVPVICWGRSAPSGIDLYTMFANRSDPGTNIPYGSAIWQPLRNGDTGNMALNFLGLPFIPGSIMTPLKHVIDPRLDYTSVTSDAGYVSFAWTAGASTFQLEASSSLQSGSWESVTNGILRTNINGISHVIPQAELMRFYRLRKK